MSYSPTVYCASTVTPSAFARDALSARLAPAMAEGAGDSLSNIAWQGLKSKYSTSRGAL